MKNILILLISALLFISIANAQDTVSITVDGYGKDETSALNNAFVAAVEQAVGTMIKSKVLIENGQLIEDKVLSLSSGFIESYKLVSSTKGQGQHKATITAVVRQDAVQAKIIDVFKSETDIDTTDLFAQASTISRQQEQSLAMMEEFFPALAAKFADSLVMEIEKITIDTENMTADNKVPYTIVAKYHVNQELYTAAAEELHNYLIQMGAEYSKVKNNNSFEAELAIYRTDDGVNMHKYALNAAMLVQFQRYFILELQRLSNNKQWQVVITKKNNETYKVRQDWKALSLLAGSDYMMSYGELVEEQHIFLLTGFNHVENSSGATSYGILNYQRNDSRDPIDGSAYAYFILPLAIYKYQGDYGANWAESISYDNLAGIFKNDAAMTLYHNGLLTLEELDAMKKIGIEQSK